MIFNGRSRFAPLAEALGSFLILALPVSHTPKLILFLAFWGLALWPLSRREGIAAIVLCLCFGAMDTIATANRVYVYIHPNWGSLACFDPFFFGFFALHTMRFLRGRSPGSPGPLVFVGAACFGAAYLIGTGPWLWTWIPGFLLLLALVAYHEKDDWRYVGYVSLFGFLWEMTGVHKGIWAYDQAPGIGVPLYIGVQWAGIGLWMRRLMYPWVYSASVEACPAGK